ncbi:MarR family winged helix-turn-helix transcriptional regulator [Acinetobacter baumannii]|uniref:MarR family winged helix-turn-helix transcriptional regulator n=1 Tax=Acinetobacter baumannii TaxID=470 RepID=UPI0020C61FEA|nr:MarR family transcriptional regulator [Acinetobacter baumannii]
MSSNMYNTHILKLLPSLHASLLEIMTVMNQPERDEELLAMAGLTLERALFPLLVIVERKGPIGVVELAGRVGRDYTTVSRQIARLEELGLVERRAGIEDKRVREAVITQRGKSATDALDNARESMALNLFKDWTTEDLNELVRLMRRLAEDMSKQSVGTNFSVE